MYAGSPNMLSSVLLLVLALTTILAAPSSLYDNYIEDIPQQRIVPGRLRIARQQALGEIDNQPMDLVRQRVASQQIADDHFNDVEVIPQQHIVPGRLLIALHKTLGEESIQPMMDLAKQRLAPLQNTDHVDDHFNDAEAIHQQRIAAGRLLIAQLQKGEKNNQLMDLTGQRMAPLETADDHLNNETVPQKRAALVLDRLLVALQKALREEGNQMQYARPDRDGPRVAPLRIADDDFNDMSSLERRGQTNSGRGRVLRCYFNAVTCF